MNNITVSGRLTRDPECKEFGDNKMVCDFTIAINGYKKEDTIYLKVKAWGARAVSCGKYCKKGTLVNVAGSIRENAWKNKEGEQKKELYILANDVEFVQRPTDSEAPKEKAPAKEVSREIEDVSEEDLEKVPF
jgi:single-strand DNA-binding protein